MPPRSQQRTIDAARARRTILDTAIAATGADRVDTLDQDRQRPWLWRAQVHRPGGERLDVHLDTALGTVEVQPIAVAHLVAA